MIQSYRLKLPPSRLRLAHNWEVVERSSHKLDSDSLDGNLDKEHLMVVTEQEEPALRVVWVVQEEVVISMSAIKETLPTLEG